MSDRIRAALQRLTELEGHTLVDCTADWAEAMIEARAALAEPEVVGPTDEELYALWNDCDLGWDEQKGMVVMPHIADFARAVLARFGHQPAPPADGEVGELVALIRQISLAWEPDACLLGNMTAGQLTRAADLLEQRHPAPVPVAERLQQLEDLAADAVSGLRYIEQTHGRLYGVGWDRVYEKADRLQPGHALPLPSGEVQP